MLLRCVIRPAVRRSRGKSCLLAFGHSGLQIALVKARPDPAGLHTATRTADRRDWAVAGGQQASGFQKSKRQLALLHNPFGPHSAVSSGPLCVLSERCDVKVMRVAEVLTNCVEIYSVIGLVRTGVTLVPSCSRIQDT